MGHRAKPVPKHPWYTMIHDEVCHQESFSFADDWGVLTGFRRTLSQSEQ
jgi:hypothetical protein